MTTKEHFEPALLENAQEQYELWKEQREQTLRPSGKDFWYPLDTYYSFDPDYLEKPLTMERRDPDPSLDEEEAAALEQQVADEIRMAREDARSRVKAGIQGTECYFTPIPSGTDLSEIENPGASLTVCEMCGRIGLRAKKSLTYCCDSCREARTRLSRRVRYLYRSNEYKANQKRLYRKRVGNVTPGRKISRGSAKEKQPFEVTCAGCGKIFTTTDRRRRFCSEECAYQETKKRMLHYSKRRRTENDKPRRVQT